MEFREKTRNCKSRDSLIKERDEKDKKEKIRDLIDKIKKNNELFESDISNLIINCFIEKNYSSLHINDINSSLSKSKKYEGSPRKFNLRNDIINSLKNNIIFHQIKKKNKFELNLEKTYNYLTSFLDSSVSNSNINGSNSISRLSKKSIVENSIENGFVQTSPVFNFPEEQNSTVNFNQDDNQQQQKYSYSNDEDNCFTFGEQSQIKANKIINKQDDEEIVIEYNEDDLKKFNRNNFTEEEFIELEKRANEKYIDNFEVFFDKNKYLSNLPQNLKDLFKLYKKNNENKTDFFNLDNKLNQIYSLIKDLELNHINPFNKLSTSFNEKKAEFINTYKVIKIQYDSWKLMCSIDLTKDKNYKQIQRNEKETMKQLIDELKKVFQNIQKDYEETKSYEKKIIDIISKIKLSLREICDEFLVAQKELYQDFYSIVNNIVNYQIALIKVNINDTVKCFYCYIDEIEKYYLDI